MWWVYGGWAVFGIILIVGVIMLLVQNNFKRTAQKNSKIPNFSNKTGAQIAQEILLSKNITNVAVQMGQEGKDHFDPRANVVRLSPSVYNSSSIYAASVAAHEVGHAIQWATKYRWIKVRDALASPVQAFTKVGSVIMMIGMFTYLFAIWGASAEQYMAITGWILFAGVITVGATGLFQLITLPVEFNASKHALKELSVMGYVQGPIEKKAAKETLRAAGMTYVIAFAISAFYLVVLLLSVKARQ